jgi:hypothetical protein
MGWLAQCLRSKNERLSERPEHTEKNKTLEKTVGYKENGSRTEPFIYLAEAVGAVHGRYSAS